MIDISTITAAVLAGGFGTRLRPMLVGRPKSLALVNGRPFLCYLLDMLSVNGVKHVVLCIGYLADMVRKEFGDSYHGMEISYSQEDIPLGTGGAFANAMPHFRSDTILAMNGDSYCEIDFVNFLDNHIKRGAEASIALVKTEDTSRYGRVEISSDSIITGFLEKTPTQGPGLINSGIYLLQKDLIASFQKGIHLSIERDIFPNLTGKNLYGQVFDSPFIDIGIPESYKEAERFFLKM